MAEFVSDFDRLNVGTLRGPIAAEYHGGDKADWVVGRRGAGLVATGTSAL